jgi:hypothetical protein
VYLLNILRSRVQITAVSLLLISFLDEEEEEGEGERVERVDREEQKQERPVVAWTWNLPLHASPEATRVNVIASANCSSSTHNLTASPWRTQWWTDDPKTDRAHLGCHVCNKSALWIMPRRVPCRRELEGFGQCVVDVPRRTLALVSSPCAISVL